MALRTPKRCPAVGARLQRNASGCLLRDNYPFTEPAARPLVQYF
jgi:hypothetical protein